MWISILSKVWYVDSKLHCSFPCLVFWSLTLGLSRCRKRERRRSVRWRQSAAAQCYAGTPPHLAADTTIVLPSARATPPLTLPTSIGSPYPPGRGATGGMMRSSAFTVLRLMASSNCVGCSTGMSAGLAPFRILSTMAATRGMFPPTSVCRQADPPTGQIPGQTQSLASRLWAASSPSRVR